MPLAKRRESKRKEGEEKREREGLGRRERGGGMIRGGRIRYGGDRREAQRARRMNRNMKQWGLGWGKPLQSPRDGM